ncbi:MAG: hypothetical protein CMP48_05600 [Rickettsiales bacterium]|nr:hypothetical protein [Rickettsiales bacterium]
MNVAVCEDDVIINNLIVDYLESLDHTVVIKEFSKKEFLVKLDRIRPDLALLDINLGAEGKEGICIGEVCGKLGVPFIFVTAYSDSTTLKEAIEFEPVGYIVKPFTQAQLNAQVELAISRIDGSRQEIQINSGSQFVSIDLSEVNYIESARNYLVFHPIETRNKSIKARMTLKEVIPQLPSPYIQIHRSFLVNQTQIQAIEKEECVMKNKSVLPLSRKYKSQVMRALGAPD